VLSPPSTSPATYPLSLHDALPILISEGTIAGEKVLLLKPQTYMNSSGDSVQKVVKFYQLSAADVSVLYDEIDLAPGKVRVKVGRSEEHTSELQSRENLVCRLLLEK